MSSGVLCDSDNGWHFNSTGTWHRLPWSNNIYHTNSGDRIFKDANYQIVVVNQFRFMCVYFHPLLKLYSGHQKSPGVQKVNWVALFCNIFLCNNFMSKILVLFWFGTTYSSTLFVRPLLKNDLMKIWKIEDKSFTTFQKKNILTQGQVTEEWEMCFRLLTSSVKYLGQLFEY